MSSTGYPLIFAPAAHDISYINIKSPAATSSVPSPPLSPSAGRISALTRLQRITGSTRQRRKSSIPRSFSDITMSGYSSKMSPFEKLASSSSDLVGVQSLPPSRQSSVTAVPDENVPRSPWSKTSRTVLRKKASVASLILRLSDDDDDVLEIPNRGHSRHWRRDSTGADRTLKCKISEPFNFQHLTHTASTHAKILRNASDGDLLSEFAAVRASQAPTEQLRGITAEDLAGWSACTSPRGDGTSEAMTALQPMKPECMDDNVNASKARIREAKSFPSLHRNSRSFSSLTPPVPVMMPPPRKSSRTSILLPVAPRTGNETMQGSPTRPDFFRHITRNASPPPPGTACSTWGFEALSAVMANSSEKPELALGSDDYVPDSNATALADVPEEDDVETMRPSVPSQRSGRSIALAPGTPVRDRGTSTSFSTIDEDELASRRDSDPVLPLQGSEPEDIPKGSSRHLSSTHPILAESWEDDVDYCYDHLLDAYSSSLGKNDLADPSPISTFTRSPGSEIDEITYQEQPSTVPSRVFLDLYERTPTTSPAVLTARARSQASLAAPDDCEYRFSHPQTLTRAFNDKAHEPLGLAILTCPPLMIPTRTTSTMPAPNTTTLPSTRYSPAYPSSADSSPESSYRASGGASSNEDDSYATSTGSTTSIPDLVASKTSTRQTSQEPLSPVTAEQSPISPFDRPPHMIGAGKGLPEKAPPTQPLEDWEMEALSRIRSLSDTPEVNEGWATKRRRAASTVTSGGARSSRAIFAPLDAIGALRC